jgi:hypothetical protein
MGKSSLFDEAIEHYDVVAQSVSEYFHSSVFFMVKPQPNHYILSYNILDMSVIYGKGQI